MIVNSLLIRWRDGYTSITDTTTTGAFGVREQFLSLGNTPSAEEAERAGAVVLAAGLRDLEERITAGLEPEGAGDTPYAAFFVGDTITVPDSTGSAASRRVTSLTVAEDADGMLTFVPELRGVAP